MRRRSFLRLLGLGLPGLALFGWFRRAPMDSSEFLLYDDPHWRNIHGEIVPAPEVSYRMEYGATRMDPEGLVTIHHATYAEDPVTLEREPLYGREPQDVFADLRWSRERFEKEWRDVCEAVVAEGPAIVDHLDLAKLREHSRRPL